MAKFHLLQRGTFNEGGKYLTGRDGIVTLHYMGSSEFGWGAIPKAYRRLMYHFAEYEIFPTGIYTPEKEELMVFCKNICSAEIVQSIRQFIKKPYHLYSELQKVPIAKEEDIPYDCPYWYFWWSYYYRSTNFWWCIDIKSYGDWMAFLQPKEKQFLSAIRNGYQDWWLAKSPEEREEEYKKSLLW